MILDALLMFDNPSAPKDFSGLVAGAYASTNTIDWGLNSGIPTSANGGGARDMGIGDDPALKLLIQVTTAFTGGTSLSAALQGASDDGSGSPGAFTTWWTSTTVALANLLAGQRMLQIDFPRPPAGVAIPRFVRLLYTTVGTMTAGQLIAGVVLDRNDQPYAGTNSSIQGGYPAGIVVNN